MSSEIVDLCDSASASDDAQYTIKHASIEFGTTLEQSEVVLPGMKAVMEYIAGFADIESAIEVHCHLFPTGLVFCGKDMSLFSNPSIGLHIVSVESSHEVTESVLEMVADELHRTYPSMVFYCKHSTNDPEHNCVGCYDDYEDEEETQPPESFIPTKRQKLE